MVRYNIDDVTSDMILGESIFSSSGELLLAAGYRMKEEYKNRLKKLGYTSVMIEVEGTEGVSAESIISEHLKREMTLALNSTAKELDKTLHIREKSTEVVEEIIRTKKNEINRFIMHAGTMNALEKFINEIMNQPSVILNMSAIRQVDASFFEHTINVTVIALCLGKKYGFSYEEMKQLGIGAINYDLGLIAVPRDILQKDDSLSEEENILLQQHTVYGYMMLSQSPLVPPTSSAVALQHHELQNGKGYPRKLKGQNLPPIKDLKKKNVIHRFAEIVTVADYYDMLTSGRKHYSKQYSVPQALEIMIRLSGDALNADIVKTLLKIIPIYPVGVRIRIVKTPVIQLSGYKGVVAKQNPENLELPHIILYETPRGERIKPIHINLLKNEGFGIELIP